MQSQPRTTGPTPTTASRTDTGTRSSDLPRTTPETPERPARRAWVPPTLTDQQRVQLAREWLAFLDQEVTEDRVAALAPVVMRFHPLSPKGQIANELVRQGQVPTPRAVLDEAQRRAQAREAAQGAATSAGPRPSRDPARDAARGTSGGTNGGAGGTPRNKPVRRFGPATRMTPMLRAIAAEHLSEQTCAQLRALVADTRAATGAGPSWSQVSKHMGWSRELTRRVIRAAIGTGILTGTAEPNSLDLGARTHVAPQDLTTDTTEATGAGDGGATAGAPSGDTRPVADPERPGR